STDLWKHLYFLLHRTATPPSSTSCSPTTTLGRQPKRTWPTSPACCLSASTTPADPKWPPASSATSPVTPSRSDRPDRPRPTQSTLSSSEPCAKRASTSPTRNPRSSLPTPSKPAMLSLLWDAAMSAPFFPVSDTSTGNSTTPLGKVSMLYAPSATKSVAVL